jgi:aspartyl-tRNA(Asn)/glutamyl-tRNA(Gln) amidotransferase subunit B
MEGNVIIGLEIHVQLNNLQSKMFCACSTGYHNDPPNTHTCPVCLGLPGSLPVLNKKAVEYAIKVGLALNCKIEPETLFYRKNYYYPDLPKGFQISQYDYPLATGGYLMIKGEDGVERDIRITRAHMEEDPGRLVHAATIDKAKYTMVDYNRCGMPLLEVVTEPDLRSPKEARLFLDKLRSIRNIWTYSTVTSKAQCAWTQTSRLQAATAPRSRTSQATKVWRKPSSTR